MHILMAMKNNNINKEIKKANKRTLVKSTSFVSCFLTIGGAIEYIANQKTIIRTHKNTTK